MLRASPAESINNFLGAWGVKTRSSWVPQKGRTPFFGPQPNPNSHQQRAGGSFISRPRTRLPPPTPSSSTASPPAADSSTHAPPQTHTNKLDRTIPEVLCRQARRLRPHSRQPASASVSLLPSAPPRPRLHPTPCHIRALTHGK